MATTYNLVGGTRDRQLKLSLDIIFTQPFDRSLSLLRSSRPKQFQSADHHAKSARLSERERGTDARWWFSSTGLLEYEKSPFYPLQLWLPI